MASSQCYLSAGRMATRYTDNKDANNIEVNTFPEQTVSLLDIKLQNQSGYPSFSPMVLVTCTGMRDKPFYETR
jgi:hypothetical protein